MSVPGCHFAPTHFAEGHELGSAQSLGEQTHKEPTVPRGDAHMPCERQPEPEPVWGYWKHTLLRSVNFAFSS